MTQFTIGRNPSSDIVVKDSQVSRQHAILTQVSPNTFVIEDCGSSNHTFVNGTPVKRAMITIDDKLSLGSFPLDLKNHFKQIPVTNSVNDVDIQKQFTELEGVWKSYLDGKRLIKNKDLIGRSAFSLAGVVAATVFIPFAGAGMVASVVAGVSYGLLKSEDDKLFVLDSEFKIRYICPKCKKFLGNTPYSILKLSGRCSAPRCNAQWVNL